MMPRSHRTRRFEFNLALREKASEVRLEATVAGTVKCACLQTSRLPRSLVSVYRLDPKDQMRRRVLAAVYPVLTSFAMLMPN